MPDWIYQIFVRFFSGHGFILKNVSENSHSVYVDMEYLGFLEIDYFSENESLLLSARMREPITEPMIKQIAQLNHYSRQNETSFTGHVYEKHVVFRKLLNRQQIDMSFLELVLTGLIKNQQKLLGN